MTSHEREERLSHHRYNIIKKMLASDSGWSIFPVCDIPYLLFFSGFRVAGDEVDTTSRSETARGSNHHTGTRSLKDVLYARKENTPYWRLFKTLRKRVSTICMSRDYGPASAECM